MCDTHGGHLIPNRLDPESPRPSHVNSTIVVPRGSSLISTYAKSGIIVYNSVSDRRYTERRSVYILYLHYVISLFTLAVTDVTYRLDRF